MRNKIVYFIPLALFLCLFLFACSNNTISQNSIETTSETTNAINRKANFEVYEVSDVVKFKEISSSNSILQCEFNFKNTDYGSVSNMDPANDYYIIYGNEKISPLELKVGDRVFFDYEYCLDSYPALAIGSYIYLIERAS